MSKIYEENKVSAHNIVEDGNSGQTKHFSVEEHNSLINDILQFYTDNIISEVQASNLAKYFKVCPSECFDNLWQGLGKGPIENVVKLHSNYYDLVFFNAPPEVFATKSE